MHSAMYYYSTLPEVSSMCGVQGHAGTTLLQQMNVCPQPTLRITGEMDTETKIDCSVASTKMELCGGLPVTHMGKECPSLR